MGLHRPRAGLSTCVCVRGGEGGSERAGFKHFSCAALGSESIGGAEGASTEGLGQVYWSQQHDEDDGQCQERGEGPVLPITHSPSTSGHLAR